MTGQIAPIGAVVPVFNGAAVLGDSIASIRAELGPEDEIVVVDDGSTDDSPDVVRRLIDAPGTPLRLVRQPNRGPAAARNAGVAALRAPLIAFLDADDHWPAGRTAALRRRLDRPVPCDAVFGRTRLVVRDPTDPLCRQVVQDPAPALPALIPAGLFRRDCFQALGGFDESLRFGEDLDWFLRALEAGQKIVIIDQVTLDYHLHDGNMTRDRPSVHRSAASALARSLARRRRCGEVRPLPNVTDLFEPST